MISPRHPLLYLRIVAAAIGLSCAIVLLIQARDSIGAPITMGAVVQIAVSLSGGIFLAAVLMIELFQLLFTSRNNRR